MKARKDFIPENNEIFIFNLTSAITFENSTPTTARSGAAIKITESYCQLKVLENDYPRGVLQIMPALPQSDDFIQYITSPIKLKVKEESENVNLYVVRAQGTQGILIFAIQLFHYYGKYFKIICKWKLN